MAVIRSIGFITFLLATLTVSTQPVAASDTAPDKEKVVEAIRMMFASMSNDNMAQYREVTTPDFYAFDMGKSMTSEQLIGVVKNARESGMTFSWQVTEPHVHINGQMAWITYVNHGVMRNGTEKKELTWLESAVLRKTDNTWRILFLHSSVASNE